MITNKYSSNKSIESVCETKTPIEHDPGLTHVIFAELTELRKLGVVNGVTIPRLMSLKHGISNERSVAIFKSWEKSL